MTVDLRPHAGNPPRAGLVLKADIRPGRTGEMSAKLERLERALEA